MRIKIIYTYSPQTKSHVERLFNTVQDRIIKEFQLQNINTIEEVNKYVNEEFISLFNEKFAFKTKKR